MAGGEGEASGAIKPSAMLPTEDTIEALIDHLVFPLLPLRGSKQEPPSTQQQESVAKQMHAVVMLYNYYHRKQFLQLEFLGFESFCKAACIAKPGLLIYMKYMHQSEEDLCDPSNQLSVTEKMVMDACNICTALDVSKNSPNMEEWPICKVAVFLIDPTKEKCLLQFCSITQGVWSLVEQDLETPIDRMAAGPQMKNRALKNKTANESLEEDVLQQLAFSAVEQKTGINRSNLSIVEGDITYSLSRERTTTCVYMMKYEEALNGELIEVSIKDVMCSLNCPLVRRGRNVEVTPVVEYFHLLPYIDIISHWLSREVPHHISSNLLRKQPVNEKHSSELDRTDAMEGHDVDNQADLSEQKVDVETNRMLKSEVELPNDNLNDLSSMDGLAGPAITPRNGAARSLMELNRPTPMKNQATNNKYFQSGQTMDIPSIKNKVENLVINDRKVGGSCMSESPEAVFSYKADSSSSNHYRQLSHNKEYIKRETFISDTSIDKRERNFIHDGLNVVVDCFGDKVGVVQSAKKPYVTKSMDGVPPGKEDTTDSIQDQIAARDLPLVPMQLSSDDHDTFYHVLASKKNDLLQASLRVLQKKRDELCQKQRLLEDEIVQCEMNIQTIISEGEENLTSKVESIIDACNILCSSQVHMGTTLCPGEECRPQAIKRKRLSEAVLSLRSPCQELDDICCKNSWILPRYNVFPSCGNGRFQASLIVQGMDFECSSVGDLKSSPREARESAATHMLSKLRSMASQGQ